MNGSSAAALVRGWVRLYTRGLPAELRDARRDEVEDDLWCEHQEAAALGRPTRSLDADRVLRLLFGVPADISWRLTYRGSAAASSVEMSPAMNTRTLGVLALLASLSWGIMFILFIPFGEAVWLGPFGVIGVFGSVVAAIAFSGVAVGLAGRFQDRVGLLGAIGAPLVALGAVMSLGVTLVPLLVGSAMLMWDLARIGIVSRLVPIVHLATAIVFALAYVVGQPSIVDGAGRALFVGLLVPYLVTWVSIGVSLLRGVPLPRATSA
jgi:hypothetical protein